MDSTIDRKYNGLIWNQKLFYQPFLDAEEKIPDEPSHSFLRNHSLEVKKRGDIFFKRNTWQVLRSKKRVPNLSSSNYNFHISLIYRNIKFSIQIPTLSNPQKSVTVGPRSVTKCYARGLYEGLGKPFENPFKWDRSAASRQKKRRKSEVTAKEERRHGSLLMTTVGLYWWPSWVFSYGLLQEPFESPSREMDQRPADKTIAVTRWKILRLRGGNNCYHAW